MNKKAADIREVLRQPLVRNIIGVHVSNWRDQVDSQTLRRIFTEHATRVAGIILRKPQNIELHTDWKIRVSSEVRKQLGYPKFGEEAPRELVQSIQSFNTRIALFLSPLWRYTVNDIAHITGCVANMIANTLDPELLRMTDEECAAMVTGITERLTEEGGVTENIDGHTIVVNPIPPRSRRLW